MTSVDHSDLDRPIEHITIGNSDHISSLHVSQCEPDATLDNHDPWARHMADSRCPKLLPSLSLPHICDVGSFSFKSDTLTETPFQRLEKSEVDYLRYFGMLLRQVQEKYIPSRRFSWEEKQKWRAGEPVKSPALISFPNIFYSHLMQRPSGSDRARLDSPDR